MQEITPSEGYLLDETVYPVGADPKLYEVEFNSAPAITSAETVQKGKITLIKHCDDGSTQIETPEMGAEFAVFLKSSGNYDSAKESERDYLTCNENDYAETKLLPYGVFSFEKVPLGNWIIRELQPAEGYLPNTDIHHVQVERDEQLIEITVVNDKVPELGTTASIDGESETVFTPETPNGSVIVSFEFDAKYIKDGTDIVVFEVLYQGEVKIAAHENINDEGQTVKIVPVDPGKPSTPNPGTPQTGDRSMMGFWIGLGAVALGGMAAAVIIYTRKKKEQDGE